MHKSFQKLMGENMKILKKDFPNLPHTDIFKKAVEVTKKMYKPIAKSFKVGKKGSKSKTRKGEKNFMTHKGDKVFHQKSKFVRKSRKPYSKTKKAKKQKKTKKAKKN